MHRYSVRHCKQFTASTPTCTQAITVDKLNLNLRLNSYLIRHSFTNWWPSLAGKIAFIVFCNCFRKAGSDSLTLKEVTCNFAVRFATYNFEATVVRLRSTITGASYEFWSHTIAVVRSIFPSNFVHAKNTWKTHWTDLEGIEYFQAQKRAQCTPNNQRAGVWRAAFAKTTRILNIHLQK